MNKRQFIKSLVGIPAAIPLVLNAADNIKTNNNLDIKTYPCYRGNIKKILSVEELSNYGIKSAIYSASCVDRNGKFYGDPEYNNIENVPFVRRVFRLNYLPTITTDITDKEYCIDDWIQYIRQNRYWMTRSIGEIKERFAYVCLFDYLKTDCNCGKCSPNSWVPVVGGMSIQKYNYEVGMMQAKTNEEARLILDKYGSKDYIYSNYFKL